MSEHLLTSPTQLLFILTEKIRQPSYRYCSFTLHFIRIGKENRRRKKRRKGRRKGKESRTEGGGRGERRKRKKKYKGRMKERKENDYFLI